MNYAEIKNWQVSINRLIELNHDDEEVTTDSLVYHRLRLLVEKIEEDNKEATQK